MTRSHSPNRCPAANGSGNHGPITAKLAAAGRIGFCVVNLSQWRLVERRQRSINQALKGQEPRFEHASFLERFRCSRAAGISSTATPVAACSAARRFDLATATLNFGAPRRASTSARSSAPTTPRRHNFVSAVPQGQRLARPSRRQATSETSSRSPQTGCRSRPPAAVCPICALANISVNNTLPRWGACSLRPADCEQI